MDSGDEVRSTLVSFYLIARLHFVYVHVKHFYNIFLSVSKIGCNFY